uniref:Uncharacterized protein n=1 Tax=viral metagenome TaxID=1070528 RepID=A0A6C0DS34_9ZZZZ
MDKTFIVGINLHGEIPLDNSGNPQTKNVENKFIIKLNAVSPGVPNISTFENYNNLSDITRTAVETNKWLREPMQSERLFEGYKKKMIDFVSDLKTKFIKENAENVKGIEKEHSKKGRHNNISDDQENFLQNKDTMFTINRFETGDVITNKLFLKFTPDELSQLDIDDNIIANKGFNKIIIYNLSNSDVFELLGDEYKYITLFDLIDLLSGMGAENIIFIDLSCSVFTSNNKISKRDVRMFRRRLTASHKNVGKKIKKNISRKRKTKNNKTKK